LTTPPKIPLSWLDGLAAVESSPQPVPESPFADVQRRTLSLEEASTTTATTATHPWTALEQPNDSECKPWWVMEESVQHDPCEFGDDAVEAQATTDPYVEQKEKYKGILLKEKYKGIQHEFGLTDEQIVKMYGADEDLEAAIGYFEASALEQLDYLPAPVGNDPWRVYEDTIPPAPVGTDPWTVYEDTNEPSLEDQLVAMKVNLEDLLGFEIDGLRSQAADAELTLGTDEMRSLIVCYFPRESNKDMIRQAFSPYGLIDSVYLVHKDGKPACYGFVNFNDHPSAARALEAANAGNVELVDKRDVIWKVKAEWSSTAEIPKKPKSKKKRVKKDESGKAEQSLTPPVDLNRALNMYHPKVTIRGLPKHASGAQTLNYTVPAVPQAEVGEPLWQPFLPQPPGLWDNAW